MVELLCDNYVWTLKTSKQPEVCFSCKGVRVVEEKDAQGNKTKRTYVEKLLLPFYFCKHSGRAYCSACEKSDVQTCCCFIDVGDISEGHTHYKISKILIEIEKEKN